MREAMVNFPTSLSNEEKHLKEMFEKLKAVRKLIAAANRSSATVVSAEAAKAERKNAKRSIQQAEEATEEVKRKVMSGAINLKKANEKSTFKRSKVLEKRRGNSSGNEMLSPTSTLFLSSSYSQDSHDQSKINRVTVEKLKHDNFYREEIVLYIHGPTLYVRGYDLQSESLHKAFEKYGRITRLFVEERRKSAFITLANAEQAEEAIKEMDGNMVNGITLRVSFARRQNQTGQPRNLPVLFPRHRSAGGSDYVPSERNSGFRSPRKNRPNDLEPHQSQMSPPGMRKTSSVQMAWNQATERTSSTKRRNDSRTLMDYSDDSSLTTNDPEP
ncbi:unnamed protein product [Enterobius vermicularis]|uniref:Negative elongation factor E n=1 Tax=Enterobius vermicularis TaxID=51028 RepID=A0A0N4VD43_ENTVE|nr:unnamed protein product [Enterobius vermicularis]